MDEALPPVRVLIIDDSVTIRGIYRQALSRHPGLVVVGAAADPFEGRELLLSESPDIVVLDLEMPKLDGLTFLRRLNGHRPTRVVVVSSLTQGRNHLAFACLEAGALDVLGKPGPGESPTSFLEGLAEKLVLLGRAPLPGGAPAPSVASRSASPVFQRRILAVGGSTGGTEALALILGMLPVTMPGIVVALHLPAGFPELYAERLAQRCGRSVRVAVDGMAVEPGSCLIAPANRHLLVIRRAGGLAIEVRDGPAVGGHKPAVDVLFQSLVRAAGKDAAAVLLTGMGKDGAAGLANLRAAGAATIAQDQASSVVWGMPGEAVRLGAAEQVLSLPDIADGIIRALSPA